ncbi:hypothetical protein PAECIP111893_02979 [Paenibacillus plantiphilus]|uniref:DUF4878 domain-containing protein n=1 Tax=Paenibacillus plantiphilus TaxID=2905650 RepID=A0ABN8GJT2_9BACL|nr:hypothetical protein [Paenibacillus plantiphilus]CAH1209095.1 hypothetical protein PAECIP111893_02979 [Paenibacillus plantiphilus]
MKSIKGMLLIIVGIVLLAGCNGLSSAYKGEEPEDPKLKEAIIGFFAEFNDTLTWEYSTDNYVMQEYERISGDNSEKKSLEKMKQQIHEFYKDDIEFIDFYVDEIMFMSEYSVVIEVTRKWGNEAEDVARYTLLKHNGEWKVDQ